MKIQENKRPFTIQQIPYSVAKECCQKWHYSKSAPQGKYKFGVFTDTGLIGCVLFGKGANNMLAKHYNLQGNQVYELTRVALDQHPGIFTSAIISKCIKEIKRCEPEVKLIVSYADTMEGHKGTLYKSCSFVYEGLRKISGYDYYDNVEKRLIKGRSFWQKAKAHGLSEKEYFEMGRDRYTKVKKSNKHRFVRWI